MLNGQLFLRKVFFILFKLMMTFIVNNTTTFTMFDKVVFLFMKNVSVSYLLVGYVFNIVRRCKKETSPCSFLTHIFLFLPGSMHFFGDKPMLIKVHFYHEVILNLFCKSLSKILYWICSFIFIQNFQYLHFVEVHIGLS